MSSLSRPWDVDVFCLNKKFLVFNLVSRNLKIKYRRSFLGLFWTLLGPVLTSVIYFYVFKVIMRTATPHYLVYILSGILPWTYFATTVTENMDGIVGNQSLISKVPIPIQVFPYAGCLTNLVSLLLSFPIVVAVAIAEHVTLGPELLYFPLALGLLLLETYACSLLLAIAYVFVRDLKHALTFVLQILLYATPIFYELRMVPDGLRWLVYLNPVALPILMIREAILPPTLFSVWHLGAALAWTAFLLASATWVVSRNARTIAERI